MLGRLVPCLIACFALHAHAEDAAQAAGSGFGGAWTALKDDMSTLLASEDSQQMIASFAFFLGIAALYDGRRFFQALVIALMAALSFCFTLSQLQHKWAGPEDEMKRIVCALEVALFFGVVTYRGWEGVQLFIGLVVGFYTAQVLQSLALLGGDSTHEIATGAQWTIGLYSASVVAGAYVVQGNLSLKVFGILAPLFGASLVASALEWSLMFFCSKPGHEGLCTPIKEVPSVVEFWSMIAYPFHSTAVGYFEATKNVPASAAKYPVLEPDRMLGLFLTAVFFLAGTCYQLKAAKKANVKPTSGRQSIGDPLLEETPTCSI